MTVILMLLVQTQMALGLAPAMSVTLEMVPIAWTSMNVLNQEITAMSMLLAPILMDHLHALVILIQGEMVHTVILFVILSPVKQMLIARIQPWEVNACVWLDIQMKIMYAVKQRLWLLA